MIKKFPCRVKEQQEESCQLQRLSETTLKGGQKPFLWCVETRAHPGRESGGTYLDLVPQNALKPCWLRRQRDSNGLQSGSSASFHQTDSPVVLSLPVFAANHFMPWHRVPELSRYTSATKILRLNCQFHSVPFVILHVVHSPVETLQIFG